MKRLLSPLLAAAAASLLLADVAPSGCGKRAERPLPPPAEAEPAAPTPAS